MELGSNFLGVVPWLNAAHVVRVLTDLRLEEVNTDVSHGRPSCHTTEEPRSLFQFQTGEVAGFEMWRGRPEVERASQVPREAVSRARSPEGSDGYLC